jgi:hypothetical protein
MLKRFWRLPWGSLGDEQMDQLENWYVVRQSNGQCTIAQIIPSSQTEQDESPTGQTKHTEQWGPYATQAEAIARRVGLIRAGKCSPA